MSDIFRVAVFVTMLPLLSACMTASGQGADWQSSLRQDHPLTGQIWRSADARFVSETDLQDSLRAADILLLGEKHDNPDHHRLRGELLARLIAEERIGLISLEMLSLQQQSRLDSVDDALLDDLLDDPDALREHLDWDVGWHWPYYYPVLRMALQADFVDVAAANLDPARILSVYREDLPAEVAGRLDSVQRDRLYADIDESHCGMLPESQFPAMVKVQQARDQAMADSLLSSVTTLPSGAARVLLAGNYHVRHDLGVPLYLDQGNIVSLAFIEVSANEQDPAAYLRQFSDIPAYDYIWFTPAVTDDDYCEAMRERMASDASGE